MRSRTYAGHVVVVLAIAFAGLFSFQDRAVADTFTDTGFATETIASFPPYSLVGMAWAPDGRLFVWEKNGVVRVIKNGQLLPTPFIDLSAKVNTFDDRGFWGLAFDPNFAQNGYVYLSYTYENGGNPNSSAARTSRLTRVVASGDVAVPGSETVVLGSLGTPPCSQYAQSADCVAADSGSHTMGQLHFASDGTLFVGVGDGADAAFADSLSLRAQDLDSPNGKILRINTDGSAPSDNPYYDGTNSWRSRVWLYGVRNPFGFTFEPTTEELFFGDVGWNTWEEVDHGGRAQNFGWPCFEGNLAQTTFQNNFPSVCGHVSQSSVTPPFFTYDHNSGSAAIGGPFYTASLYPEQFHGNFFFGDYSGNFIKRVVLDDQHKPVSVQPFATNVHAPVSMSVGPDGMLYYLSFTDGELRRIRYNGPVAQATATPKYGYSPLSVSFSSAGSVNPGGGSLNYQWDFGDGVTSTAANPSHTYSSSTVKTFAAKLTVTNSAGLSSTSTAPVTIGSVPPTPTIDLPADGTSVRPGQTINYHGSATDPEDGNLTGIALQWTVLLHHNTHVHTFVGDSGSSGSFVAENHGPIGTFSYEVILTATDSSGLKTSTSVNIPVVADTSPPSTPAGFTVTASASNRVDLSWSASTDDVALEGYRVERCAGAACTDFAEIAAPSGTTYSDIGLLPATTYRYRVRAADSSLNFGDYSNAASATTLDAPPTPPGLVAAWPFSEGMGTTTLDATGNNNNGAITGATWSNQGRYGTALSFNGSTNLVRVASSASLNLSSAMTLSAWIKPAATQSGWRTIMQKQVDAFFLNASSDTGPLRPAGGATFGGSTSPLVGPNATPVGSWTYQALTYDGSTVRLYISGTLVASRAQTGAIQTTSNPLWIGGNQPYGEYFNGLIDEARVYNRALSQTEIQSDMSTPLVPTAPDTTPPSAPTSISAMASGGTQVNVSWTASSDNVGVSGYSVERCQGSGCTNFTEIATPATNSFTDTGLAGSTTYRYRVRATDLAGNLSQYSSTADATTSAAPDTTPPTAPTGLAATAVSTSRLDLSWTAATDNVGVVEYRVERCQGASCTSWAQVGTTASTSFSNTGLATNTTYRFRVRAADAAGNVGSYSTIASGRTLTADTTAPSAPTGLIATPSSPTQVNLAWTASTDNVGVTGYRVERCQGSGCTSWAEIGTSATASFNSTGLTPGTLYRFRVRATDAAGNNSSYSSIVNATTPTVADTTPPTDPTGLTATASGAFQVDLAWTGSTDNVAVSGYRLERCEGAGCTSFAQISSPTGLIYSDTSVVASTSYRYRIRAVDASANLSGYSNVADVTTPAAPANPPGLVGAWAFNEGFGLTTADASGNNNTATISGASWTPLGRFGYALSFNGSGSTASIAASPSLSLSSGMTLSAWINPSASQSGWRTIAQRQTDAYFLNASSDAGPLRPAGGGTLGGSTVYTAGPTANPVGAWTYQALTYDGSTLRLYINGTQIASRAQTGAIQASSSPLWIGGNQPYGEFFNGLIDEVRVYNRALTQAELQSDMNTSIAPAAPDTTAPSVPGGLNATAASSTQVNLSWTASTDNAGVSGYRVERCVGSGCTSFGEIATPAGTSFSDTGVAATSTYRYRVRAVDAAGNLSDYSTIATVTTPATADTTAPSAPAGLTATAVGPTQVDVDWTASTDNVGVTGYRVERCQGASCTTFAEISVPTVTSYSDIGRSASTTYRYRVRATDAAGNLSAYSSIVSVTTPSVPDTTPPSAPTGLTATATGTGTVNLAWTAAADDVGVMGYRVERCSGSGCSGFGEIATATGTSYGDAAVATSTTYRYRVRAVDAAGNLGPYSGIAEATTPATPSGLVGAWAFGEGSGTTSVDASGNNNTATLQGATWSTAGKYGNALSFNGTSSIVRVASAASLNLSSAMTLSAWVNPAASQSGWRTIMQKQVDAYFLNASNDSGPLRPSGGATFGGSTQFVTSTTANPVNTWTHVALTYDGSIVRLYVNGTQVATRAQTGAIQTSSNPLWIGGNQPYGEFFNGLIDEARIYNRALSQAEIQSDMNTPLNWTGLPSGLL
jgi:glucose/arabinose dehydrogenase/fibronectin type 3 domain-containing protein